MPATKCVTPRVACVRIPRFPIGAVWLDAVENRAPSSTSPTVVVPPPGTPPPGTPSAPQNLSPPHWDEQLLALRDGQRLRAVTAAAARLHVRAGMTVAAAADAAQHSTCATGTMPA